jgi:hypothetical protein
MRKSIWILLLIILTVFSGTAWGTKPGYLPLNNETMGTLLQKIIETKLIPLTATNEGLTLNITKLNTFVMDWERERIILNVNFTADYDPGFFKVSAAGRIGITGAGLIAATEQKIGVKLLEIQELKIESSSNAINEPVRRLLNKILAGKEFWQGDPPSVKETLTEDNYVSLLKIAVAKGLPIHADNEKASITLTQLETLNQTTNPGQFEAVFTMTGRYKSLITMSFEGKMGLTVSVSVDPTELAGETRIDSLTSLDLKNVPSFLDSVIRSIAESKIKGTTSTFSWK